VTDPFPEKPKGMRCKTYDRLKAKANELEMKWDPRGLFRTVKEAVPGLDPSILRAPHRTKRARRDKGNIEIYTKVKIKGEKVTVHDPARVWAERDLAANRIPERGPPCL
jgi:hypothetical protein